MTTLAGRTRQDTPQDLPEIVPIRHWGRLVSGVVVLALVVYAAWRLTHLSKIQYPEITKHLFQHTITEGVKNTIIIAILAQVIGTVLGIVLATMRLSKNPVLSVVSWVYIWFFRGTPQLVQILFWFNGLLLVIQRVRIAIPFTHVVLYNEPAASVITVMSAAVLALGLNEGAYMAEITRAGLIAVDVGQTEAAHALGMGGGLTLRRVVLPQAMRVIIPPTGNEFISLLKTTSLVQAIGQIELLGRATAIYSQSGAVFELLIMTCIWYLFLTSLAYVGQYYLERRFARGSVRDLPMTPLQRIRAKTAGLRNPGQA